MRPMRCIVRNHQPHAAPDRFISGRGFLARPPGPPIQARYARIMASIQDTYFEGMKCFGCGPANPDGLQLKSYVAEGGTVATFVAAPAHDNGLGFVNGGIISTVLDCHSATPILIYADDAGLLSSGIVLPYVTAGLDVRYLRPTPLGPELSLFASIEHINDDEAVVYGELTCDDKVRATARAHWKRWRPRG